MKKKGGWLEATILKQRAWRTEDKKVFGWQGKHTNYKVWMQIPNRELNG
jgi:hypothetical protein